MNVCSSDVMLYRKYMPENGDSDSRWESEEVFKAQFERVSCSAESLERGGVPMFNDGADECCIEHSDANVLIFGSTRSMKTRRCVFETVNTLLLAGESVVVHDPKGEIFERTAGLARKKGYKIRVINLREPRRSNSVNLLGLAYYYYHNGNRDAAAGLINDLAYIICKADEVGTRADPYWADTSATLFSALAMLLLHCGTAEEATMKNLVYTRNTLISDDDFTMLRNIASACPRDSLVYSQINTVVSAPDRTRASIISCFDSKLRLFFAQKDLVEMLSGSEIDLTTIGTEPTAIYIISPDEKKTYNFITSTLVKTIYETLVYVSQTRYGGKLPVRTNFILDEFGNLSRIADFDSMVSAGLGRGIRFTIILQNMFQLTSKYDAADAETIMSNCIDIIFLTSRELPLLDRLSRLCGNGADGSPLITPSRLQRLNKEKGEALVISNRLYPFVTHLADIDSCAFPRCEAEPLPRLDSKRAPLFDLLALPDLKNRLKTINEEPELEPEPEQEAKAEPEPKPAKPKKRKADKSARKEGSPDAVADELEALFDQLFRDVTDDD